MRFFRYRREETLGAYNFGQYQIYVCALSNPKGIKSKGITVLCSDSIIEMPFPLNETAALELSNFLESIGSGEVPKSYTVKGGLPVYFASVYFKFKAIKDGMLKGRISLGFRTAWVTVNPSSVLACSQAIRKLYGANNA